MANAEFRVKNLKELEAKLGKIIGVVKTGGKELNRDLGFQARNIARRRAPDGVRPASKSLKGAITYSTRTVGKGYEARVTVKGSNNNNLVALRNEFGMKPEWYYVGPGTGETDLKQWIESKLPNYTNAWFKVGGSNTRLGKKNVFWKPSFIELQSKVPKIVEKTFTRRINRALK